MCRDGGPKSIGRQKQKLCHLVFGWQSTGYKEVQKKKKKHRVTKVIYKYRLSLNADSQSCLLFTFCMLSSGTSVKFSEMSPDKQNIKEDEQRRP